MKPTPTPNVIEAASFLVDRLEEFERELNDDAVGREYYGHVHPAFARLVAALSVPAAAVVGEPEPIGYCSEYGLDKLASQAHHYCLSVSKSQENEFQFPIYASRVSKQDAELERLRREVEEAREQANFAKASDQAGDEYIENMRGAIAALKVELAEARKAAFIESAEIASEMAKITNGPSRSIARRIEACIRGKAEETGA